MTDHELRAAFVSVSRGLPMIAYAVSFYKLLCDQTGHMRRCEQGCMAVTDALTPEHAVEEAKRRFEESRGIVDWRTHADGIDVRPIEEGERLN